MSTSRPERTENRGECVQLCTFREISEGIVDLRDLALPLDSLILYRWQMDTLLSDPMWNG